MNVVLRPAVPADAEGILAIYEPFVRATPVTFEVAPPTPDEMRRRVLDVGARYPWLVCVGAAAGAELGSRTVVGRDRVLGYAYASRHRERAAYRWAVEVSAYVAPEAHRRGIGRALYTTLFALLRLQGFRVACAGITLPNPASVGLHEGLGFEPVGTYRAVGWKLGAWHDVGWWQLDLQPAAAATAGVAEPAEPAEPRGPEAIRQDSGYAAAFALGAGLLRPAAPPAAP